MRHRGPIAPITKTHPLTGEPIEPVGVVNGRLIWPVIGASPDEEDDEDDEEDEKGKGDTGDSGSGGSDDDKDSSSDGDSDTVSRAEFDAIMQRMKAADKRADQAEKKIKDQEDAKKDDLQKALDKVSEQEQTIKDLQGTVRGLNMQNAFLTANKHDWHDAETALGIAQQNGYLENVVDDDGAVDKKALTSALDRLAKEKAFLVKEKEDKSADEDDDHPSGQSAGNRSDNAKDRRAREQQMRNRFPSLNR